MTALDCAAIVDDLFAATDPGYRGFEFQCQCGLRVVLEGVLYENPPWSGRFHPSIRWVFERE